MFITALTLCFGFAWLADLVGLAPIVGAFAAGLVLEGAHYRDLADKDDQHDLEEVVKPLSDLLVPIFFVMIGIQVSLHTFADVNVLGLAGVLIVAAVIGKQICSFGVWQPNVNRLSVGIGMIPRGEVGIIFASIGHQLRIGNERIIDTGTWSALVLMVMVTTLLTPPLLKWSLSRANSDQTIAVTEEQE